jgi:hypothetical protein
MLGTKWYVKQGDSYGYVTEQLLDEKLDPVDLTAIIELGFYMRERGAAPIVADTAHTEVLGDPTEGIVRYQWQAGDLDTAGEFQFEWRVTFSTDQVQTFPSNGYNTIDVVRNLAP